MPATIRDIAKKVGKSITTVSRALNNYDDISSETKALVRQAAQELGYKPSITAQRLQRKRSDTIGFILPAVGPRFSDPFFSEILAGIASQAAKIGVDLLVSACDGKLDDLEIYFSHLQSRRVDGFILVRIQIDDARVALLTENNFPLVTFGDFEPQHELPFVDVDTEFGMSLAAEYLLRLGHRHFGVILPPAHYLHSVDMLRGVKKKLAESGLALDETNLAYGDFAHRTGYLSAQRMLASDRPPTAIIAGSDLIALGAINAAQERGLTVGRELSITGFEDIFLAEYSRPPLTTLKQPTYQIGQKLCGILVSVMRGEAVQSEVIYPSLIIRESCGPLLE